MSLLIVTAAAHGKVTLDANLPGLPLQRDKGRTHRPRLSSRVPFGGFVGTSIADDSYRCVGRSNVFVYKLVLSGNWAGISLIPRTPELSHCDRLNTRISTGIAYTAPNL